MGICPSIGAAGTPAYEAAWRHAVEVGGGWGVVPQHCHSSSTGVLVIASKMIIIITFIHIFSFPLSGCSLPQNRGIFLCICNYIYIYIYII